MFHYGIAGWSMYALLGMAMGYFAYRWGMPLSIRAALYPLLGKRVRGPLGDGISIIALVGTVFGVATSMGIGVVLLNVGFAVLFGLEQGLALQIALVIGAVVLTIGATTSGVDRGIRWISELNLWSAVAMMVYILLSGETEQGWYALLSMFPGATFLIALATLSGLLFYLTSANSGAMVMSNFSASIPDPAQDGPKWLRIFWAVLTAVLTVAMLLAGGRHHHGVRHSHLRPAGNGHCLSDHGVLS